MPVTVKALWPLSPCPAACPAPAPGPTLPETRGAGRAVQYGNSFLLVGGSDEDNLYGSEKREDILYYDPDDDAWQVMEQKLEDPDNVSVALIAPDGFSASCS